MKVKSQQIHSFVVWILVTSCENQQYYHSWIKNTLFCSQFSPKHWKSHFRALKFQNFLRGGDPPRRRGLTAPCWYSLLLYSNLLATSIIIETPDYMYSSQVNQLYIQSFTHSVNTIKQSVRPISQSNIQTVTASQLINLKSVQQ